MIHKTVRPFESKGIYGGVVLFAKCNIAKGIEVIHNVSTEFVRVKLKRSFFNSDKDIYLCLCYISPKESTFSKCNNENLSVLENIEQDLARFSAEGEAIIIGDLNANINPSQKDYVESDSLFKDGLPSSYICDSVLSDRRMIKK